MQNLRSLACTVWIVGGGGWFEKAAAHLIFGGNFLENFLFLSLNAESDVSGIMTQEEEEEERGGKESQKQRRKRKEEGRSPKSRKGRGMQALHCRATCGSNED